MADEQTQREDTMLYREPTPETDDHAVQDIWGEQLETRVVDASEVPDMLSEGWVKNPLDLGKKPEERAGFQHVAGKREQGLVDALEAAEKLAGELGEKAKSLTEENAQLATDFKHFKGLEQATSAELSAAKEHIARVETDLETERTLRAEGAEHIQKLEATIAELKGKSKG
jgi:uncharacterized protein with von Willebrand factor type A (vWA) domain